MGSQPGIHQSGNPINHLEHTAFTDAKGYVNRFLLDSIYPEEALELVCNPGNARYKLIAPSGFLLLDPVREKENNRKPHQIIGQFILSKKY